MIKRFDSFQRTEQFEVMIDKEGLKSYLDDEYIRKQSVLYLNREGRINKTSFFNI